MARTLIQALLASRVPYAAPRFHITQTQWQLLQRLHRAACQVITGLPKCTETPLLYEHARLILFQTLVKNALPIQLEKHQHTITGRRFLAYCGYLKRDERRLPAVPQSRDLCSNVVESLSIPRPTSEHLLSGRDHQIKLHEIRPRLWPGTSPIDVVIDVDASVNEDQQAHAAFVMPRLGVFYQVPLGRTLAPKSAERDAIHAYLEEVL